ncbi:MAG: 4Fe-4S binding protein, partial [Acidobacteriota bacterium]
MSPSEPGSRRWTRWRRLTQAGVALFYLALPWVNAAGFREVAGTLASLKVGPVDLTEPVAALAAALAGLTVSWELVLGVAPVAALALLAGPVFCSWVCPWGLISEGVDRLRQRLGPRPWRGSPWVGVRRLRWAALAGVLLAGALLAAPLGA